MTSRFSEGPSLCPRSTRSIDPTRSASSNWRAACTGSALMPSTAAESLPVPAGMTPSGMSPPASTFTARCTIPSPPHTQTASLCAAASVSSRRDASGTPSGTRSRTLGSPRAATTRRAMSNAAPLRAAGFTTIEIRGAIGSASLGTVADAPSGAPDPMVVIAVSCQRPAPPARRLTDSGPGSGRATQTSDNAIPSRMSCSLTTNSVIAALAATSSAAVARIIDPPPITSTRPGCM